ncbi:MAG: NADP-dependent isocitrate dehydrogenase [Pseudomonadota bacterium]|nr:NADP-dependent isocitrate dehydrogenase [Pseudomonadota bacterium]
MKKNQKIAVKTPLVELDGDEMTRIMWQIVKELLILPYLDIELDYHDLHVKRRDDTNDQVTVDAARAIMRYGVGVKCATITPTEERVREYSLKEQWKSPNGTIRALLDGTVFRAPIFAKNIRPFVTSWKRPIIIGRHAYGDVYSNAELPIPGAGRAEIVFTPEDGGPVLRNTIHDFAGPGIIQGIHNTDASIAGFAKACFTYALDRKVDLWFSAKDTISKTYDARFRAIFDAEFSTHWRERFAAAGIEYFFTLIDDAAARIVRSEGGILWALKNYDGDVMSDMIAAANGSLAMMTSVLVSPRGYFEYEAAHGTVQRHYYQHLAGKETSTNSMALIFAWTGGLRKRGELDGTPEVAAFADQVEAAALETVEAGIMTGDLLAVATPAPHNRKVATRAFIEAVAARLEEKRR